MTLSAESFMHLLAKLEHGQSLGISEMHDASCYVLDGHSDDVQNVRFLEFLSAKGETDQELLSLLGVMSEKALSLTPDLPCPIIDVCGTGGDMQQTFNISTAASFVAIASVAHGKCAIAKHGNHSTTGVSGSADVFAALGHDNNAEPPCIRRILEDNYICFIFAQKFHPAMKYVAPARRALRQRRTAFNILGPLANPAPVSRQIVGVSSKDLLYRIPRILLKRGTQMAIAVMSSEGMDELSTVSSNIAVIADGSDGSTRMTEMVIRPEDVGLCRSQIADIRVRTAADSVARVVGAIDGTASRAVVETVVLNAAGALLCAGAADDLACAVEMCKETVQSGTASKKLDSFVNDAGDMALLEGIRDNGI